MHAVVIRDGDLRWEKRPDPEPGATELLVAVRAAGLNNADLMHRDGRFLPPPWASPDVPKVEVAGEVVSVGRSVKRFSAGDRVMGLATGGGGHATLTVLDELHTIAVPDGLAWPDAGGFCEANCTAFDALFTQCALVEGHRVLVSGAAGGVGAAGVQLAAAAGAEVVASVRNRGRHGEVAALGAAQVVAPEQVAERGPYDVVLELVGAPSLASALPVLAVGGRVAVIGVGAGARLELDLLPLMHRRGRLGSSTLRMRDRLALADVVAATSAHVLPLLAAGRVRVPICATLPMAEAPAAYEGFAAGDKLGKVALIV